MPHRPASLARHIAEKSQRQIDEKQREREALERLRSYVEAARRFPRPRP